MITIYLQNDYSYRYSGKIVSYPRDDFYYVEHGKLTDKFPLRNILCIQLGEGE